MAGTRRRTLEQRLFGRGPKRILSIDGGGARAIMAAGVLQEVERRLSQRCGRPDFRLCEYFDLIGGVSTGAVLAAGLALGKSVAECAQLYRDSAPEPSDAKGKAAGIRRQRFAGPRLEAALTQGMGEEELGSSQLKTGLALFTKRADTGAPWTLTNNPKSRFFNGSAQGAPPASKLVVRKLVQACAGGQVLFDEVRLKLDHDAALVQNAEGLFVDAAIAGLGNPSLELLKLATLQSHGFEWPSGEDQLLMISVGAGYWRPRIEPGMFGKGSPDEMAGTAVRAVESLKAMVHDTSIAAISTMQALSRPPRPWRVDADVEDMRGDHLSPFPLLSYQRMDWGLDREAVKSLDIEATDQDLQRLREPGDDPQALDQLYEVGVRVGQSYFRGPHPKDAPDWEAQILPPRFDPEFFGERGPGQPKTRLDAMGRLFERRSSQND